MVSRWLLLVSCLVLALTLPPTNAKKDQPNVVAYEPKAPPNNLFYFEDTDIVLMHLINGDVLRSFDAGVSWKLVEDDGMGNIYSIYSHPFDRNAAYAIGKQQRHWMTVDQGKTWKSFQIDATPYMENPIQGPFVFHGQDSSKIIFETKECDRCSVLSYYTTDNFATIDLLGESAAGCTWAVANPSFAENLDISKTIRDRTLCVAYGLKDRSRYGNRLIYSDDYFTTSGIEMKLENGRPVSGLTRIAAVKKFLVAAVESKGTYERALYVTIDGESWHRAEFDGHKIEQEFYTILESTDYSLQVNILSNLDSLEGMGTLFTSNSNGTYFTRNIDHTNCNLQAYVDFEKIAGIDGIVLVNIVSNPEEVDSGSKKQVVSKISFDDGRTFQDLKVDGKSLHLHSVTENTNMGRVFSSPAPGLVMGVGNTGDYLKSYSSGDLYVSDDAGLTWRHALDGPHKYEFGDQGAVLMAIGDSDKTKKVEFSLDHGKTWHSAPLKHSIAPWTLTTTPDSTSLKFILVGAYEEDNETKVVVYSIDFAGLHERKCEKDDFDNKWPARLDEHGEPDCLMGRKQFFKRRKANADCFVEEKFNNAVPDFTKCKCTAEDFECVYKRSADGKSCIPPPSTPPEGKCKDSTDEYMGPSGWRLIPGNECIRDGGENLDKYISRPCEGVGRGSDEIISTQKSFNGKDAWFYYLERQTSNSGVDETIMMLNTEYEFWVSHDHGKTWNQFLEDEKITAIVRHPYNSDTAFILTDSLKAFFTIDHGHTFKQFKLKTPIPDQNLYRTMRFHPSKRDWLIWHGVDSCDSERCPLDAWISKNRGADWELLQRSVTRCEFESRESRPDNDDLIYCAQYKDENPKNPLELYYLTNDHDDWKRLFENVSEYATNAEFIFVATHLPENPESLKASVSVDGTTFADAHFPPNIIPAPESYTVLDSSTHAAFLYVTMNDVDGAKYGSIVKSNSNGTLYALSLDSVNQIDMGYIDFERMQVLEGVIIANIVSNTEELSNSVVPKKLRTVITHNDGGEWALLAPPLVDANGEKFSCSVVDGKGTDDCSLHLHGYTERKDERDTFSSSSAIGLMLAVGNVGDHLSEEEEPDTFISRDGGVSWKSVKKGRYMWEYGDSGSVIVIVSESKPTNILYYSTDEGENWLEYEFSKQEMAVQDILTVPSDTSKQFLIWGKTSATDNKYIAINVDFSAIRDSQCTLNEIEGGTDDYDLWEPRHPFQTENCIFGHVEQYHRKKLSAKCWNNWREPHVHNIGRNCTCTRADYECDYNYELQNDGSCALVPGLEKPDASQYCSENPDAIEYWETSGYRRIPQTTCEGGNQLDQIIQRPCPGKQDEYDRKHGISGVGLFFAIIIPITVAGGVGYYAYSTWDGKFGQIRLGESAGGSQGLLSRDSLFVTVPITIIAGVVAVAKALPLLATSLWRSASGYMSLGRRRNYSAPYSSRDAFAARRGDYTSVVDDEDELLGVEDPDVDEDDEI